MKVKANIQSNTIVKNLHAAKTSKKDSLNNSLQAAKPYTTEPSQEI